jgi:hypothetical protein
VHLRFTFPYFVLRTRLACALACTAFVGLPSSFFGQAGPWSIESTNEGIVEVQSRIWEDQDINGDDYQIIEYRVTTFTDVSVEKLKALLYAGDRHKEFMPDTEVSDVIQRYSPKEWLMYYYFDSPWPLPNSDCVTRMTLTEEQGWARFDGIAAADLHPRTEDRRMDKFEISYQFSVDGDRTKLVVHSTMTPVVHAPDWLVSIWFPDGPAELVLDLIERAKVN